MGFSRQEYWSGLPCSPPGDLLHPEIEPVPSAIGRVFTAKPQGKPREGCKELQISLQTDMTILAFQLSSQSCGFGDSENHGHDFKVLFIFLSIECEWQAEISKGTKTITEGQGGARTRKSEWQVPSLPEEMLAPQADCGSSGHSSHLLTKISFFFQ